MSEAGNGQSAASGSDTPGTQQTALRGPGAQLAAKRQESGLTIEQVAQQLNLASRQIAALEADNYSALPGIVITRGFIRAYAKLLKIDAAPLLAMITEHDPKPMDTLELQRALSPSYNDSVLPDAGPSPTSRPWLGLVILMLVALLGGAIAYQLGWLAGMLPELDGSADAGQTAQVSGRDVGAAPTHVQNVQPSPAAPTGATPAPTMPAASLSAVANTSAATPSAASGGTIASTNATPAKDNIVLKFREDSWVEIRRADRSVLISRLVKGGTVESFPLTQPSSLVVGNASGVDVIVRGNPVDIQKQARNNVARIELK